MTKKNLSILPWQRCQTIKEHAAQDPDGYLALALLYTGCRISELCALLWSDYHDGVLHICKAATRSDEGGMKYTIADTTKSKRPRDVVLNAEGRPSSMPSLAAASISSPTDGTSWGRICSGGITTPSWTALIPRQRNPLMRARRTIPLFGDYPRIKPATLMQRSF